MFHIATQPSYARRGTAWLGGAPPAGRGEARRLRLPPRPNAVAAGLRARRAARGRQAPRGGQAGRGEARQRLCEDPKGGDSFLDNFTMRRASDTFFGVLCSRSYFYIAQPRGQGAVRLSLDSSRANVCAFVWRLSSVCLARPRC